MFTARQARNTGVESASTATLQSNDDDDLYSFEKKPPTTAYNGATWTSAGRTGLGTASFGLRTGRPPGTDMRGGDGNGGEMARPMTSVRAAGYSSRGRAGMAVGQAFDPFHQGHESSAGGAYHKLEETPEEQIRNLERKVNLLIEDSTTLAAAGNLRAALEKAKEAGKKERQLSRQREQLELGDQMNLDLTYCVLFNLANQYQRNQLYQEALNTYGVIVKNKLFNQSGRLRVNMGNIYFEQKKYSQAVKMYRMALDQISNVNKDIRLKIMRNIGNAFIRMGQFQDAITSFEAIMEGSPDYHAGFNLILCYFALGDRDRMKRSLQRLMAIRPPAIEQNEDFGATLSDEPIEDHEVFDEDELRAIARERQQAGERCIVLAAKLVAPSIENTFSVGYDWIVEAIKASPHAAIASEIEIAKAIQYLRAKDFTKAVETLKMFEKTDQKMIGTAATNLSFLYFLDGDYKQAEKYAELAITTDRYNAKAQTNRGNCYFVKKNFEKAKDHYQQAINVDAVCTEAMYNLGLVNKELGLHLEALQAFEKLYAILRDSAEVIFQIADIYDKQGNLQQAMEWFNILISVVPTDPGVLARLGDMFVRDGDKSQAFQYYSESYRYFPSNMDVLAWLGAYYVECEVYEQAVQFFERAVTIQPAQVRWQLMIASCYRRSGNYQQSFETYKRINEKFPDNVECLRFLVRICTDLGMKELHQYAEKLARTERAKELAQAENTAAPPRDSTQVRGSHEGRLSATSREHSADGDRGLVRSKKVMIREPESVEKIDPNPQVRRPQTSSKSRAMDDDDFHEDVNSLLPE
ncbi:Intraflagellar transport protein 88 [Geranomyces variabilis]|nr:Intraflagellar transport protein 88 [Geranomyces variabilis]